MTRLQIVLATWFGSGYSPIVSGTAGTAATIPLVALLWWKGSWPLHLAAIVLITAVGLWAAAGAEQKWGKKDPGKVVIDETAGYLVTTFLLHPVTRVEWTLGLAASFVLFRVMDILKPWPARQLEALPGSLGIMIDDLFAGVYAFLLLQGGFWLLRAQGMLG